MRKPTSKKPRFTWSLDEAIPGAHRAPGLLSPQTIARAAERGFERGDSFILIALGRKADEVTSVTGQLANLNSYAVELTIRIRFSGGAPPWSGRLVAARNDRERGETVKAEFRHLQWLSSRLPKNSPLPLKAGTLFQTDRHGRDEHHRRLPAYATLPIPESVPCMFGNREQLAGGAGAPRLMSRDETDHVRRRVIELCLRAYDPETRRVAPPPDVDRGAMRIIRGARGKIEVFIASCPVLWEHVDPVSLAHRLTGFEWRRGSEILPLLPSDPSLLLEAFVNALGKERGRKLLSDYAKALAGGRYPEHRRLTKETLASVLGP